MLAAVAQLACDIYDFLPLPIPTIHVQEKRVLRGIGMIYEKFNGKVTVPKLVSAIKKKELPL